MKGGFTIWELRGIDILMLQHRTSLGLLLPLHIGLCYPFPTRPCRGYYVGWRLDTNGPQLYACNALSISPDLTKRSLCSHSPPTRARDTMHCGRGPTLGQRCVLHLDRSTSPAWNCTVPCSCPQGLPPRPGMDEATTGWKGGRVP